MKDLVLSSGFLAMARHCGVLAALEETETRIDGLCGTSSGALVGAYWAAGWSARGIATRLTERSPWRTLRFSITPWRGLFSLRGLRDVLARDLPKRFGELEHPLAVGVVDREGQPRLLSSGDLVTAVAASCAVPYLFSPQRREGAHWADGGAADRLMIEPFRAWRGPRPTIVHRVESSLGREGSLPDDVTLIETPRSRATFLGWNGFESQLEEARKRAVDVLGG